MPNLATAVPRPSDAVGPTSSSSGPGSLLDGRGRPRRRRPAHTGAALRAALVGRPPLRGHRGRDGLPPASAGLRPLAWDRHRRPATKGDVPAHETGSRPAGETRTPVRVRRAAAHAGPPHRHDPAPRHRAVRRCQLRPRTAAPARQEPELPRASAPARPAGYPDEIVVRLDLPVTRQNSEVARDALDVAHLAAPRTSMRSGSATEAGCTRTRGRPCSTSSSTPSCPRSTTCACGGR